MVLRLRSSSTALLGRPVRQGARAPGEGAYIARGTPSSAYSTGGSCSSPIVIPIVIPKLRIAVAAAATVATAFIIAPQAAASDKPEVQISKNADAGTMAFSRANPEAVAAAATVCGSGFDKVNRAIPLPKGTDPRLRLATLFTYINSSGKGCAILDNNRGIAQYMYLKVCEADRTNCDADSGTFSQYAGPVRVPSIACAPVTAKMGQSASRLYINYTSDYAFPCN
jgi:hypothetical protein